MDPAGPKTAVRESVPYGHACAGCSKAKCRCISRGPGKQCERCHRLRKECVPSAVVRKQTSRRASGRSAGSAQLEEKLDRIVTLLTSSAPSNVSASPELLSSIQAQLGAAGGASDAPHLQQPTAPSSVTSSETPGFLGVFSSTPRDCQPEVLNPEDEAILLKFREHHLPLFPFVHIPPGVTALKLSRESPVLWLGIQLACTKTTAVWTRLESQLRSTLAQSLVVDCERNLDLLLGIICYLNWKLDHNTSKKSLCTVASLATSLVFDLRLDRATQESTCRETNSSMAYCFPIKQPILPPLKRSRDGMRAALACYCVCSAITGFIRSPQMRWTSYMDEVVQDMATQPEIEGDEVLAAMTKLYRIMDEVHQLSPYRMEPELVPQAPLVFYVRGLKKSLDSVMASTRAEVLSKHFMQIFVAFVDASIHDMPLYHSETPRVSEVGRSECLHASLEASIKCIETFLAMSPHDLVGMTVALGLQFARCSHLLYRFSVVEDVAWDRKYVQDRVDLIKVLERTGELMAAIPKAGGFEPDGEDVFTRSAMTMKYAAPLWGKALAEAVGATSTWTPGLDANGEALVGLSDAMPIDFPEDFSWMELLTNWDNY
ncbi:hypothetical protein B0I35DRAFT_420188 [Stachybotrys elegans]|uniref:Zn(2)-C6 fungal-type domain-containing protein n=1 Tax=Stachybotrys elegans TaxID=80388 RepID=A0A8K0T3D4_9HYPO|nr:hypothetical protein B0I35DRAFT_420188 [Stachybotrys elegans]